MSDREHMIASHKTGDGPWHDGPREKCFSCKPEPRSLADDPAAVERGAEAAAAAIVDQAGEAGVDIPSELPKWLIGLAPRVSEAVLRAADRRT